MTEFNLAINMSFVRKRWTEPSDWARLIKHDLRLQYAEFCSDLLDPILISERAKFSLASKIKEEFEKSHLSIIDYYGGIIPHCLNLLSHSVNLIKKNGIKWCEGAIELAAKIGTKGIGGHFDTIPYPDIIDSAKRKEKIAQLIESFQRLSGAAKKAGLEFILWEQMYTPSEVPHTITEAEEIYECVNENAEVPIYLTVDLGHCCNHNYPHSQEDLDPYIWLEKFAPISPVIHLQQTDGIESRHWPFTDEFNKIGIIHPRKVIETIEKSGSQSNYLVFEIFHSLNQNEQKILDDLKYSIDYWQSYLSR